jgi:ankyrin repeat protein
MFNSNPDIVSLLIKKGADANNQDDREGFTVLMMVAYWSPNPIPLMRVLIDNGADVNLQNKDGLTALMFSIANFKNKESEKSIAFLLDSGANPNIKDKKGNTALDIATDMGKYNGSAILERLEEMTSAKPE